MHAKKNENHCKSKDCVLKPADFLCHDSVSLFSDNLLIEPRSFIQQVDYLVHIFHETLSNTTSLGLFRIIPRDRTAPQN